MNANNRIPQYALPRDTKTVVELLRIWREGIAGMPAIDELEQRFGCKWRSHKNEREFFSTRKVIIDEVAWRASASGTAEKDVAKQMDRQKGQASLDRLMKVIRAQRKLRPQNQP